SHCYVDVCGLPSFPTRRSSDLLAALHALAGLAAGSALSVTHGTIARSANPHRLFALVGIALGVFAVVFLAGTLQLIAAFRGTALDRKSTRLNSSHVKISYAVFC